MVPVLRCVSMPLTPTTAQAVSAQRRSYRHPALHRGANEPRLQGQSWNDPLWRRHMQNMLIDGKDWTLCSHLFYVFLAFNKKVFKFILVMKYLPSRSHTGLSCGLPEASLPWMSEKQRSARCQDTQLPDDAPLRFSALPRCEPDTRLGKLNVDPCLVNVAQS